MSFLQFIESWDMYPTGNLSSNNSNWINGGGNNTEVVNTFPRTGSQCLFINDDTGVDEARRPLTAPVSVIFIGFGFREGNNSTTISDNQGVRINGSSSELVFRRRNVNGQYSLLNGTSALVEAPNVYSENAYHFVLIKYNTGTGDCNLWIDREDIGSATSSLIGTIDEIALRTMARIDLSGGGLQATRYDDVFVLTDPNPAETSVLENGADFRARITTAISDISNTSWAVSGATSVHEVLNNIPFVSTQFIEATSGVSANTVVEFEDITSGVANVLGVQIDVNALKTDAGPGTLRTAIIVSGVSANASDMFLSVNGSYYSQTFTSAPNGNAWEVSDLGKLRGSITRVE